MQEDARGFFGHCKAALSNLIASDEVHESEDPLISFSEGIVNFHSHYCLDMHSFTWCHHEKVMAISLVNSIQPIEKSCMHTNTT